MVWVYPSVLSFNIHITSLLIYVFVFVKRKPKNKNFYQMGPKLYQTESSMIISTNKKFVFEIRPFNFIICIRQWDYFKLSFEHFPCLYDIHNAVAYSILPRLESVLGSLIPQFTKILKWYCLTRLTRHL